MKWSGLFFSLLTLSMVACKDKGGESGGTTGDPTAGATVYADTCASCHGASGEGTEGYAPSMTEEVPELSDAEIEDVIMNGYEEMPAQSSLTSDDVANVIAYLRETFGEYEG